MDLVGDKIVALDAMGKSEKELIGQLALNTFTVKVRSSYDVLYTRRESIWFMENSVP